jgi:1,4-dihydroxy-2-naphthoate octaprenyltransferase
MMKKNKITQFIRLSRPIFLIAGVGLYFLGAGIAKYLGNRIDWGVFILGLLWVLLAQLAALYLNEYFDEPVDRENESRTVFSGGSGVLGKEEGKLNRKVALSGFVVASSLAVALTLSMLWDQSLNLVSGLLMILIYVGGLLYSLPPIQLIRAGYGEFIAAVIGGYLVPMLSFYLQSGEVHRLVVMASLPVVLLLVVFMLAASFPDYATDLKYGKRTFLVRAGWENVVFLHNTLILLAFLVLAAMFYLNFPRAILFPAFLTFPLGALEFWQMRLIAAGGKPNWKVLTGNAAALVGSLIYIFSYFFWTR